MTVFACGSNVNGEAWSQSENEPDAIALIHKSPEIRGMSYHKVVSLPVGKIQFYGSVRGADEAGHYAFTITLVDRPAAYGEWVPLYPETGGDTRVEIVRFGYGSINNIDNPSPGARRKYLEQEVPLIRTLIEALFSDDEIRKQTFPFTGPGIKYLGPIVYRPGWIITESIAELGRPF